MDTPIQDSTKKTWWAAVIDAVTNPMDFLQHWTKKSPIVTILAVVFLLQPAISTGIDIVKEIVSIKKELNPANRSVTKAELDLLNQRVAFLQGVVVAHMNQDAVLNRLSGTELKPLADTQKQLDDLSKKLDTAYINKAKK